MAEGFSQAEAIAVLTDMATRATHMKLYVGPPGPTGVANAAVETTRKAVTWGTPALVGAAVEMANTNDLDWTAVAGTEDYTHAGLFDHLTAGNFRFSGLITADAVVTANDFSLPAGAYIVRFPLAS